MSAYIHGQNSVHEVARLEYMAAFTAPFMLRDLALHAGQRVLDLGCGVGAMTQQLANYFDGLHLFGVDIQRGSLATAQANHPMVGYTLADAARLPYQAQVFSFVHSSWLLEHVPSPLAVLHEVRRVLKPNGQCQFTEVDNASFQTTPEYPEVSAVLETLNRIERETGSGDPYIGQHLGAYFEKAGFARVDVHAQQLIGDASHPAVFAALIEVFAAILESVESTLGIATAPTLRQAVARLRALPSTEGSAICYAPVIARAMRSD